MKWLCLKDVFIIPETIIIRLTNGVVAIFALTGAQFLVVTPKAVAMSGHSVFETDDQPDCPFDYQQQGQSQSQYRRQYQYCPEEHSFRAKVCRVAICAQLKPINHVPFSRA